MRVGVVLPQVEIGNDPVAIRDYAQAVEGMGYTHALVFDHVLGANPERPGGFKGPYDYRHGFHEPFVLFGFLAGVTQTLGLVTGILILPQRQTALVAKQAAAVDVLSGGRLRLGVAVGWNYVEYEALGQDFHVRGKRLDEQMETLRALWTKDLVTREGRFDRVVDAGINPLPVQRPIPLWIGGHVEAAMRRATRLGDGWMWSSNRRPDADAQALADKTYEAVKAAGRDPAAFGIEGRVTVARLPPDQWASEMDGWRKMRGVTHLSIDTMRMGLTKPSQHIETLRRFKDAIG